MKLYLLFLWIAKKQCDIIAIFKMTPHSIGWISNSHYETDFGVSSAAGAGNTKIGFLKARQRRAFKKPILIMRIAEAVCYSSLG